MVIMAGVISEEEREMIPKIMVVPDDVVIYLRFKNQTNEIPTILRKSEVKKIINNLKEKINR